MRSVLTLRVSLTGLFVAGLCLVVLGASHPQSATAAREEMTRALSVAGFHLTPPQASQAATADGDLNEAINLARAHFGSAGEAAAIPGTLTVDGYRVGGENAPLTIVDRAVIAVQITGLQLPAMGAYGSKADPSRYNHELVVFVDANSGEYLMATTVR